MNSSLQHVIGNPQIRVNTIAIIAYGMTMAAILPYQSVIGIKELGMNDAWFAGFMFASAVMSVLSAVLLGAWSDTLPNRKALMLTLFGLGVVGYGMIYAVPRTIVFVAMMLTLVPLARSVYSLLFGSMRRELDGEAPDVMAGVNSTVRSLYALSWIFVPGALGWWLKDSVSLLSVFLFASLVSLFCLVFFGAFGSPAKSVPQNKISFFASLKLLATRPIMLRLLFLALGSGSLTLHNSLHPLVMTGPAHGTLQDVGIYAGLLAAIEAPFMLIWAAVARKTSIEFALGVSFVVYAIYAVLMSFASAPWHLYSLAILSGCGAAAILSLPVTAFQELVKDRPGLATSMIPIMVFTGSVMSSAGFALGTYVSDYSGTAYVIALMCIAGAVGLYSLERA